MFISGLAGLCFYFQLITEADNTRILTSPPQSPFRIGQRVRFTCEVDSTSTDNLTYQWKSVEYTDGWGFSYSGQSFNRTFHDYSLRYSWFFCSVWKNGTRIASSNKIVEVHGKIQFFKDKKIYSAYFISLELAKWISLYKAGPCHVTTGSR